MVVDSQEHIHLQEFVVDLGTDESIVTRVVSPDEFNAEVATQEAELHAIERGLTTLLFSHVIDPDRKCHRVASEWVEHLCIQRWTQQAFEELHFELAVVCNHRESSLERQVKCEEPLRE